VRLGTVRLGTVRLGTARLGTALLAAALLGAALVLAAAGGPAPALAATTAPAAAAGPAGGGCYYRPVADGYRLVCTDNSGSPGGGGPGGGGGGHASKPTCTLTPLSQGQASFLGLQWPAPKGHTWEAITCPGNQPFGGVTLVNNATGAPAVTPQQLALAAYDTMKIPLPQPQTAPPRGRDGLVGLPEWFWIPGQQWAPVTAYLAAGPVWARVTAAPARVVFDPGGGLSQVSCAGPGTAYRPSVALADQHTDCSYLYHEPSAGQPGNAYAAAVTVFWHVTWVGSGNTGGVIANARPMNQPFTVRIAAGEALVTGG